MPSAKTTSQKIPLVYCVGEPAGVGVDLAIELAHHPARQQVVAVGCRETIMARAQMIGRPLECLDYVGHLEGGELAEGQLHLVDRPCPTLVKPGKANTDNISWVLENLDHAFFGIRENEYAAMVTGPIDKSVIMSAEIDFSGHTEYLAGIDRSDCAVMLLASESIKVALATTHTPMEKVAEVLVDKITSGEFAKIVHTVVDGLRGQYGLKRPRLAICGLNPHAGEGGRLGREEVEYMTPEIEVLKGELDGRAKIIGPIAADTAFTPPQRSRIDAHICMYHDQGLTAIKSVDFGKIVNTTLGLSFVRTSVDHGVAYDRAGTGRADPSSLFLAVAEARRLSDTRAKQKTA